MATFYTSSNSASMGATLLLLGLLMTSLEFTGVQSIGVCYGGLGNDLPPPQEVVDLYKSNNIASMRIYYPDQATLQVLRGSNIGLILDVPNTDLQRLASDVNAANSWVQVNIRDYSSNVNFKYIAVGNEVSPATSNTAQYVQYVLPAMQNVYNAIASAGLTNQIKVSTAIDTNVLGTSYPPSQGAFRSDIRSFLDPIVTFLVNNNAPLLLNVYPYFIHIYNPTDVPLPYALFNSTIINQDGQLQYRNVFDALVDAVYAALEKVGGSSLEIVVTESGWPSAGDTDASIDNARTYNQNLIQHVKQGTPKKPGRPLETYVFAMFNENQKDGPEREKHFGLFYPNKQPVYPINFN